MTLTKTQEQVLAGFVENSKFRYHQGHTNAIMDPSPFACCGVRIDGTGWRPITALLQKNLINAYNVDGYHCYQLTTTGLRIGIKLWEKHYGTTGSFAQAMVRAVRNRKALGLGG